MLQMELDKMGYRYSLLKRIIVLFSTPILILGLPLIMILFVNLLSQSVVGKLVSYNSSISDCQL